MALTGDAPTMHYDDPMCGDLDVRPVTALASECGRPLFGGSHAQQRSKPAFPLPADGCWWLAQADTLGSKRLGSDMSWTPFLLDDVRQYRRFGWWHTAHLTAPESIVRHNRAIVDALPADKRVDFTAVGQGTAKALSQHDLREAVKIGRERQFRNRNVVDRKEQDNRTSIDIVIQGVMGEFAATRRFGMCLADLYDTTPRSAGTETHFDGLLTPENWTVDVKVSCWDTGRLRIQPRKASNPPDLYALFVYLNYVDGKPLESLDLQPPVLRFDGFIPARDALVPEFYNADQNLYWVPKGNLCSREALHSILAMNPCPPPKRSPGASRPC